MCVCEICLEKYLNNLKKIGFLFIEILILKDKLVSFSLDLLRAMKVSKVLKLIYLNYEYKPSLFIIQL